MLGLGLQLVHAVRRAAPSIPLTDPVADLVATVEADRSVTLTWTDPAAGDELEIRRGGVLLDSVLLGVGTFSDPFSDVGVESRYFRPSGSNIELPRGVTSDYDLLFDEATQTLTTVDGSGSYLWNWKAERVGAARHAAVAQTRTVTATGSAGWTEFLGYVTEFTAGTGDWEIKVPAALTMSDTWTLPSGADYSARRLYVTFSGTLPTADVMPTTAELDACSVWTGPSISRNALVLIDSPLSPKTTLTGIVLRPVEVIAVGVLEMRNPSTHTVLADLPSEHVIDRCWLDGSGAAPGGTGDQWCRRGALANARCVTALETWITDVFHAEAETSGWGGWNGAQYQVLRNVYLESRSIGMLYGGADPSSPESNLFNPHDNLSINVACTKKAAWMTGDGGAAVGGIKNGFESKNNHRWFIWNCVTYRHANTGQSHAMLFQNLSDGNTNALYNRVEQIVVHNHEFRDCQNGLNLLGAVAYGGGDLPTNHSRDLSFTNVRLVNHGTTHGASGYSGNPFMLLSYLTNVELDGWTWLNALDDYLRAAIDIADGRWTGLRLTNFAGNLMGGMFGQTPLGFGRTGWTVLNENSTDTPVWEGHAMYGGTASAAAHQPGLTYYADAAAMGFDTTTGELSPPSTDDGVDGTTPGCNHTVLDAGIASMSSWAWSR